jgi:hypothetical protein
VIVYIDTNNVHDAVVVLENVVDYLVAVEADQEPVPHYLYANNGDVHEPEGLVYAEQKPCGCIGEFATGRGQYARLDADEEIARIIREGGAIAVLPVEMVRGESCPICAGQMPLGEVA